MRFGGIEAGGTKIVCGIGDESAEVLDFISIPTGEPEPTLARILEYLGKWELDGLGIASFGPVEVDLQSPNYGAITQTPKVRWRGFNWVQAIAQHVMCPIVLDTDVNAAALGEAQFGAATGLHNCVYFTVGTGIGGGFLVEGHLVHGLLHPEAGHMLVRRHPHDEFAGICPFHGDCLEGLASGPAMEQRSGRPASELPADDPAWDIEAYYLAQAVVNVTLITSTQRVILGGGVMHQTQLLDKVRQQVVSLLGGYIDNPAITHGIDTYIVPPALGDFAGLKGAFTLAMRRQG